MTHIVWLMDRNVIRVVANNGH